MRHTATVNAWRVIKFSFFIIIAIALYSLITDNESLQSDNVRLSNAINSLSKTCIVVGK
jgi:hypothetical protein